LAGTAGKNSTTLWKNSLDRQVLLELCEPALERGEKVAARLPVKNTNRVVGTILGYEVTRRYGEKGLPEDTIRLYFKGSAGQSFGAFIPKGITMTLEGDANDYFGKGLSGGKLIVFPPAQSKFVPEENVIVGNVSLYGPHPAKLTSGAWPASGSASGTAAQPQLWRVSVTMAVNI
jgi:glutamate synthase (ferredoxin)